MDTRELSDFFEKLEKTSSRIEITKTLALLFGKLKSDEADKVVYMVLGRLAPSYESVVFNVAEAMMIRSISEAYGVPVDKVKKTYKSMGDLGLTAESYAKSGSNITVNELYSTLYKIAEEGGEQSVERKVAGLSALLSKLDAKSVRFIARIPIGKLRLGFSDKTVLDALSWMEVGDKSKTGVLERTYEVLPDAGKLAAKVKKVGIDRASENMSPQVGTPVAPMLPQRLKSTTEMVKKMGEVAVEPKFDGLRVQIHFEEGKPARAFTRNLNNISEMFPELLDIGKYLKAKSVILDSEAIGVDEKTKKFADFQTTMNRRRKHNIAESARNTPLRFQIFDIMFLDGKNMMQKEYLERRRVLEKVIKKNKIFSVDESIATDDPKVIKDIHEKYLKMGLEGVMVKKTTSKYVPGRTGWRWVKMKEVEEARGKLADTVDAVVMGYTRGKGKRVSFGVGQFLAGILDKEKIKTITKVGTGLTDEQFRELNKRLKKIVVKSIPKEYEVHKDLEPDYWVSPEVVVELAADELTKSPKHTAGLALRFPRLVKFRDDKPVSQATSLGEIKKLYKLQRT